MTSAASRADGYDTLHDADGNNDNEDDDNADSMGNNINNIAKMPFVNIINNNHEDTNEVMVFDN